ncbi:MAG: MaoC family dehydratase [Rhodobacteraceae bacterium]|nr:MaoC family dehydratase [Paracoccaceae bacterium]
MITIEELKAMAGQDAGHSEWMKIDQDRINKFAEVTEDYQFIHIDHKRAAAETPFGSTIAHGFLTLSLLSYLNKEVLPELKNKIMTFNYGLNKVRFLNPVKVGSRIRSKVELQSVEDKPGGRYLCQYRATVEIEGEETPALIAEQLAMHVIREDG